MTATPVTAGGRVPVLLDALTYVVAVAALSTLVAVTIGVATGGGLVRAKVLLFLGGAGLVGYATVRLWPSRPAPDDGTASPNTGTAGGSVRSVPGETRFQRLVDALPPARWVRGPPPNERLTAPGKLFWGGVATLLVSYVMEAAFGIV